MLTLVECDPEVPGYRKQILSRKVYRRISKSLGADRMARLHDCKFQSDCLNLISSFRGVSYRTKELARLYVKLSNWGIIKNSTEFKVIDGGKSTPGVDRLRKNIKNYDKKQEDLLSIRKSVISSSVKRSTKK